MIQKAVVYRSLFSRSPVIKFSFWFVLALTLLTFCFGTAYMAISFLMIVGMGLGISIQNYRRWEGAQLIPDFRKSQTIAAIHFSMGFTLLTLVVVALLHGPSLLLFGLTAGAPALGLAVTFGKPSAIFFVFGSFFMLVTAPQFVDSDKLAEWFFKNPFHIHEILGTLGCCLSVAEHVNLYHTAEAVDKNNGGMQHSGSEATRKKDCPSPLAPSRKHFWQRLNDLLSPLSILQAKPALLSIFTVVLVIAFVSYRGRNSDIQFGLFVFYAAIVVLCSPLILFMIHLPKAFERAWILGMCNSRTNTARQLYKLSAMQSVCVLVAVSLGLMITLPFSGKIYANAFLVLFAAFAAGTFSLWLASVSAKFWYRHGQGYAAFLVFLIFATTAAAIAAPAIEQMLSRLNQSHHFVRNLSLGMCSCAFVSLVMWSLCFTTASRSIGREPTLME